jgi:hypothetical protein
MTQEPTVHLEARPSATDDPRPRPSAVSPVDRLRADAAGAAWPERAAETVDALVSGVHDKAIRPLILVARVVVYGLLIGTMLGALALLASIALLRLIDVYLFPHQVWASYLLLGGVFTLAGLIAWSRRTIKAETS